MLLSLQTTLRHTLDFGIAVLARSRHACHAIERVQSFSAHFSASKSVEVRALGSLIRAFSGWSKAAARVAAVLRNAGVIMLVRRDILSKRGFLAGRGRLVPDGERHEHDSHQNGVLAALLVSRRRRHAKRPRRVECAGGRLDRRSPSRQTRSLCFRLTSSPHSHTPAHPLGMISTPSRVGNRRDRGRGLKARATLGGTSGVPVYGWPSPYVWHSRTPHTSHPHPTPRSRLVAAKIYGPSAISAKSGV